MRYKIRKQFYKSSEESFQAYWMYVCLTPVHDPGHNKFFFSPGSLIWSEEQEQTFSDISSSLDLFIQKFNACLEINSSEWNQLGMRSDLWFLVNFLCAQRYYLRRTFY